MEKFKKDCPAIWGGMVNLLAEALQNYKPYIADRYGRDIRMPAFYDYEWESTMKSFSMKPNEFITLSDADVKIPSTPNRLSREINNLRFEFQKAGVTYRNKQNSE